MQGDECEDSEKQEEADGLNGKIVMNNGMQFGMKCVAIRRLEWRIRDNREDLRA